jgi:hypothetical protein
MSDCVNAVYTKGIVPLEANQMSPSCRVPAHQHDQLTSLTLLCNFAAEDLIKTLRNDHTPGLCATASLAA